VEKLSAASPNGLVAQLEAKAQEETATPGTAASDNEDEEEEDSDEDVRRHNSTTDQAMLMLESRRISKLSQSPVYMR
jgi:hypothetical protein